MSKTQQDSEFHNFDADPVSSLGVELFTWMLIWWII